jgi:hypothetical protein
MGLNDLKPFGVRHLDDFRSESFGVFLTKEGRERKEKMHEKKIEEEVNRMVRRKVKRNGEGEEGREGEPVC